MIQNISKTNPSNPFKNFGLKEWVELLFPIIVGFIIGNYALGNPQKINQFVDANFVPIILSLAFLFYGSLIVDYYFYFRKKISFGKYVDKNLAVISVGSMMVFGFLLGNLMVKHKELLMF